MDDDKTFELDIYEEYEEDIPSEGDLMFERMIIAEMDMD